MSHGTVQATVYFRGAVLSGLGLRGLGGGVEAPPVSGDAYMDNTSHTASATQGGQEVSELHRPPCTT